MTTGQISDPFPLDEDADGDDGPHVLRRRAERALQAVAFDTIGAGYAEAFPVKDGQLACGRRLLDRLEPGDSVLDVGCGTGDPTVGQLTAAGMRVTGIDLSDGMLTRARAARHQGPHTPSSTASTCTTWPPNAPTGRGTSPPSARAGEAPSPPSPPSSP
ncbi:class I SAM-dependent methyltransferase [Kitasatospora aburaviensis]